jgi:photosystem II stability/assembly factor-like uncharacterized protein
MNGSSGEDSAVIEEYLRGREEDLRGTKESFRTAFDNERDGWARWTVGQDEGGVQPEDVHIRSITFSPNFSGDATVFAAGSDPDCHSCAQSVLFRSADGGATWRRLPAKLLEEQGKILLPPAYGDTDHRIFAGSAGGIQVSDDGGASFRYISPINGMSAAISPAFNDGDPRILTGNFQYDDHLQATTPAPYVTTSFMGLSNPAFSPAYAEDHLVLFAGAWLDGIYGQKTSIFRCVATRCTEFRLTWGSPRFRFTSDFSTSRTVFAFSPGTLYRSLDAGATFSELAFPGERSSFDSVAIASSKSRLFVGAGLTSDRPGLFTSDDLGVTWRQVDHPLFGGNAVLDVALSGNRVIAVLYGRRNDGRNDLACSADGGITWDRRCPPAG